MRRRISKHKIFLSLFNVFPHTTLPVTTRSSATTNHPTFYSTSPCFSPFFTANCLLNFHFHFLDVREDEWLVVVHKYTTPQPSLFSKKCSVFRKQKSTHTFPSPPPPPHSYFIFNTFYYGNSKRKKTIFLCTTDATADAPATVLLCVSSLDWISFFFY